MIKTLPINDVKQSLASLVSNIQKKMDEYVITVEGKPVARLVSNAEYESLKETLEILSDPKAVKGIKDGEEDFKKGRFISLEQFEKELGL